MAKRQALLTLEAALRIGCWYVLLKTLPFRWVATLQRRAVEADANRSTAADGELALVVRGAIRSATARLPFRTTCLMQALAAASMLRSRAAIYQLNIGADRNPTGAFEAHAWVESQGLVVAGEGDVGRYRVMLSLPERGSRK